MTAAPESPQRHTLRTFALVCVAVTSFFVMGMSIWLTFIMSDPSWCDRAVGAAEDAQRPESAFSGCFQLLTQQMSGLSIVAYIFAGVVALCLLALMVIVVAGGKISFKGNATGVEGNISGANDAPIVTTTTTTAVDVQPSKPHNEPPVLEDTP